MAPADCELCEAARITPWFHEDDVCWIAECEACSVPIVVWKRHGAEPPTGEVDHMIAELERIAAGLYGADGYSLDRVMRQIPEHFHAHARDKTWWKRRFMPNQ